LYVAAVLDLYSRRIVGWSMKARMTADLVTNELVMASFFSRIKDERTSRSSYRSRDEARADTFDDIERFYNPRRRHSSLGEVSPVEFERRAKLA